MSLTLERFSSSSLLSARGGLSSRLLSRLGEAFEEVLQREIHSDCIHEDRTSALLSQREGSFTLWAREPMVLCGSDALSGLIRLLGLEGEVGFEWGFEEGARVEGDRALCRIFGQSLWITRLERALLNTLATLSGTATTADRVSGWVARGSDCRILDTRKTIPGLRELQKYAVWVGGGFNHRLDLGEAILVKENHIAALGSMEALLSVLKPIADSGVWVEVEVETRSQLEALLSSARGVVRRVMLDNWAEATLAEAIAASRPYFEVEVSGVPFEEAAVRRISELNPHFISLGPLTKHLHAIDLSLRPS